MDSMPVIDLALARKVLETEAAAIQALVPRIDGRFSAAVELLLNCRGRVVLSGMGKSGIICRKIAATLTSTGTPALFLHPAEAIHGDLGVIQSDDVVIALSSSGETEVLRLLETIRRVGAKLIAMTGVVTSTLGEAADVTLECSISEEACPLNLAPTASTTAALAMGDALAMTLLAAKGFRQEDFANLHPGGKLGKKFMRVETLMHAGVSIADPLRVDIRGEERVGRDVRIDVNVVLEGGVTLGDRVVIGPGAVIRNATIGADTVIHPYSVIDGAAIDGRCVIGPYARLRPGSRLAEGAHVGNFVELKNTILGAGSKANHLTYLGDSTIGAQVNGGAGVDTVVLQGAHGAYQLAHDTAGAWSLRDSAGATSSRPIRCRSKFGICPAPCTHSRSEVNGGRDPIPIASRPPGFNTRSISATARFGCGKCSSAYSDTTQSKDPSANGSRSASASSARPVKARCSMPSR